MQKNGVLNRHVENEGDGCTNRTMVYNDQFSGESGGGTHMRRWKRRSCFAPGSRANTVEGLVTEKKNQNQG